MRCRTPICQFGFTLRRSLEGGQINFRIEEEFVYRLYIITGNNLRMSWQYPRSSEIGTWRALRKNAFIQELFRSPAMFCARIHVLSHQASGACRRREVQTRTPFPWILHTCVECFSHAHKLGVFTGSSKNGRGDRDGRGLSKPFDRCTQFSARSCQSKHCSLKSFSNTIQGGVR